MPEQFKPPSARLSHRLPGRVRLKIEERRGDERYFGDAIRRLGESPAVTAVTAKPATGSILIHHRGAFEPVAQLAATAGLFAIEGEPSETDAPVHPLSVVASGFSVLGMYQLGRGRIAGNAVEALWNGYGAAVTLGSPWLSGALVAVGAYQLLTGGQLLGAASSLFFYAATARHMTKTASREAAA
jgi:hypothetical protein